MSGCHVPDQNHYQSFHHIWGESPVGTPGYLVWWWIGPTLNYRIKPSVTRHPQIKLIELILVNNKTPTVRGLAADNNNMQSVLMGNMETI